MTDAARLQPVSGVVFDLDGTLTAPTIDFDAIRSEIGIEGDAPILETLAGLPADERRRAFRILEKHEERAAADSRLNPGAEELLDFLDREGLPRGLVTRNTRRSVEAFVARHRIDLGVVVTREDAPPKPSPAPLLHALERLNLSPRQAIYVGDHEIDRLTGKAAGVITYIVRTHPEIKDCGPPEQRIDRLSDLIGLIRTSRE